MELYYKEALLINSNLHDELHLHGDGEYSILDLEPPTAAAFNEYSSDDPPSWFAPESTILSSPPHHQLCSLPPTIGPGLNLRTSQEPEALSSFRSSSGGESEAAAAAASQGSSSTQADRSSRTRKLEDYDQHSSTTFSFLPPTISARGGGGFQILFDDSSSEERKKPRLLAEKDHRESMSYSNIDFKGYTNYEPDMEAIAKMKEMIYLAAALRPLNYHHQQMDAAKTKKPKRKNVRVSSDPQTVAARRRREGISDRLRVLQKLVPGGSKMDTASMLDEAANYLSFLKSRVTALETLASTPNPPFPTLLMQHHHHHHSFPPLHQNPNPRPLSSHTVDHLHHGRS